MESLLIPALKSGELGKLTDQMVMLDPTLEKWNPYLTATCRHLVKSRLYHVLYEFQIFMKVSIVLISSNLKILSHIFILMNLSVIMYMYMYRL